MRDDLIAQLPQTLSLRDINLELARRRLIDFTTYTMPRYEAKAFHRKIAEALDKVLATPGARLGIFVPPQHGKSELVTRRFPAQALGKMPNLNVIVGSYDANFARKFSRSIKATMRSSTYKELFPNSKLDGDGVRKGTYSARDSDWDVHNGTEKTGSLMSVGVGTGATGNPCDLMVLDDVIKNREEAESETYREKLWYWWTDSLRTRLKDSTRVVMTFTRWHEDDLAGRILADEGLVENGGKWVILVLPAIKESNDDPQDDFREVGEPLWPEVHSLKTLLGYQQGGSRTWTSVYQQRPAPKEGGLIKREYFPIWTSAQVMDFIKGRDFVRHFVVDTAFTNKTKNDPSAVLEFFIMENLLFVLHFKKYHLQMGELLEELKRIYAKGTKKSFMYIEPKANGISIVQLLQRIRLDNGNLMNVKEDFNPDVDKYARAAAIVDILETGRVILVAGHWNEVFLTDCAVFPNGKEKEAVDTIVQAVDKLQNPGLSSSSMRIGLPSGGA